MHRNRYGHALSLASCLFAVCLFCTKHCRAGKPNFVLIVADDLGYGEQDQDFDEGGSKESLGD